MSKKQKWLVGILALLFVVAVAICIWKLNTKINTVHDTVIQMKQEGKQVGLLPDVELMKQNAPWDNYSTVERFNELPLVPEYLHAGDTLDLCGMTFTVLSAYDDYVDTFSNDLLNDGSIMFRVKGQKESMLFCSDVGIGLSELLMNQYGERIKSDYVQMGHHGFGRLSEAFYRMVAPKGAFFDAPKELLFSDSERSAKPKVTLMEDAGAVLYTYLTAPNQIILK